MKLGGIMTKIVISSFILFISVLSAQRLTIKKPKNNSNIVPEDVIDIEWTYYRVDGKIKIITEEVPETVMVKLTTKEVRDQVVKSLDFKVR